jgi:hypothetical protein
MPTDKCYLPLHVGRESKTDIGFTGDNTGKNISLKNPYYSELTGLYWAWKNLNCTYLGLVHYRRHFSMKSWLFRKRHTPLECVLTDAELDNLLKLNSVLLPARRHYYIETIASHYQHTMTDGEKHLAAVRSIILEIFPDYVAAFDRVMSKRSAHMFNMFIMPKALADKYCAWLYKILFELEDHIDTSKYSDFDKRYLGRVSEMLLDVWLVHNKIKAKEIGRVDLWKVNWMKKITGFLASKLFRVKQKSSL